MLDLGAKIDLRPAVRMKSFFFDRPAVSRMLDRQTSSVFSRFGAFVRSDAKRSIRSRKGRSTPGQPPHSHTGTLKRFIYFAMSPSTRSVLIGPEKTNQVFFGRDRKPVRGTVPEILEYGSEQAGPIGVLYVERNPGFWRRADLRSRRRLAGKRTKLLFWSIRARPYMHPAFNKNLGDLPRIWAGVARK